MQLNNLTYLPPTAGVTVIAWAGITGTTGHTGHVGQVGHAGHSRGLPERRLMNVWNVLSPEEAAVRKMDFIETIR